jgi:hypothetical protein
MESSCKKIFSSALVLIVFVIGACKKESPENTLPYLVTSAPKSVYSNTAIIGGNVTSDGGEVVTEKGICFGTMSSPDVNASVVTLGSGIGGFEISLVNLLPSTKYYARAFAKNNNGVAYGNIVDFTTTTINSAINLPSITTNNVSAITSINAICGGNVISDGGGIVSTRGICWSTEENPDLNDAYLTNANGTGTFNITMPNLQPSTIYYVRAFATNDAGTAYGLVRSFTTEASYSADNPCDLASTYFAENNLCNTFQINLSNITPTANITSPSCYIFSSTIKDVWVKVYAPPSTELTLYTFSETAEDLVMTVYSSDLSCNELNEVACLDDITVAGEIINRMPSITLNSTGDIYYVRIWSYEPTEAGTFLFCATYE